MNEKRERKKDRWSKRGKVCMSGWVSLCVNCHVFDKEVPVFLWLCGPSWSEEVQLAVPQLGQLIQKRLDDIEVSQPAQKRWSRYTNIFALSSFCYQCLHTVAPGRVVTPTLAFPAFYLWRNSDTCWHIRETGSRSPLSRRLEAAAGLQTQI